MTVACSGRRIRTIAVYPTGHQLAAGRRDSFRMTVLDRAESAILSRRGVTGQEEVAVRKRRGSRRLDLAEPGTGFDKPEAEPLLDEPGDVFTNIGTGTHHSH